MATDFIYIPSKSDGTMLREDKPAKKTPVWQPSLGKCSKCDWRQSLYGKNHAQALEGMSNHWKASHKPE